jgi:hypothetical protein
MDLLDQKLIMLINSKELFTVAFQDLGTEFKFYLHLKQKGGELTLIKLEAE